MQRSSFQTAAIALLVNLILFALFVCLADPIYESNDDVGMMMCVSGLRTGEPSQYLVFSNILIGRTLKQLFLLDNSVNWYSLYLYGTHVVSMTALLYVFTARRSFWPGIAAFLIVFAGLEFRFLIMLQWTSTAILAAGCGILLLLNSLVGGRRKPNLQTLAGGFLLIFSAMIRSEAYYLGLLISLPLIVYEIGRLRSKWIPISLASVALVVFAVQQYDHGVYSTQDDWREFQEYNALRGRIHDHPIRFYNEQTKPIYDEAGWSENDTLAFQMWFIADKSFYSKDNLKIIVESGRKIGIARSDWSTYLGNHFNLIWRSLVLTGLNLLIALVLSRSCRKRVAFVTLTEVLLTAGVFGYLSVYMKLAPRVTLPALFLLSATIFYLMLQLRTKEVLPATGKPRGWFNFFYFDVRAKILLRFEAPRSEEVVPITEKRRPLKVAVRRQFQVRGLEYLRAAVIVGYALIGMSIGLSFVEMNAVHRKQHQAYNRFAEDLIDDHYANNQKITYVFCGSSFPSWMCSPFSSLRELSELRLIRLGWATHSPHYRATLRRCAIDDPNRALYEKDYLRFFSDPATLPVVVRYIEEHYGRRVSATQLQTYEFPFPGLPNGVQTVVASRLKRVDK